MNRRGFFRALVGAAAAAVTAPITSLVDAAVEVPILFEKETLPPFFDLKSLQLPMVHSDFWFSTRVLLPPEVYE